MTALIGLIVSYLPALLKAAQSVPEVLEFVKKVQSHLKQTNEWTPEQAAAFDKRLEEVTSQEHWQPEK